MATANPKFSVPIPVIPGLPIPVPIHVPGTSGHQSIPGSGVVHDAKAAAEGASSFLTFITDPSTWIRLGEILVGVILVSVGIDHAFSTNVTAKGVAKVAPFLL